MIGPLPIARADPVEPEKPPERPVDPEILALTCGIPVSTSKAARIPDSRGAYPAGVKIFKISSE